MDACPPLEDIAAFIDGTLSPEERERVTAHLARCESCYEVFAGAVEFQESSAEGTEGRGVLPFPLKSEQDRAPRRTPRWLLPLAASVVLTAGVGFFAWQALRPPKITLADVADAVPDRQEASQNLFVGTVHRGNEESASLLMERPKFMDGVYLLDLRLRGNAEANEDPLPKLDEELKEISWWQDPGEVDGQRDLRKLEVEVQEQLEGLPFSFGLWAEAGRLAAVTRSPEFFERRNNRRFLSLLLKEDELPVAPEIKDPILGYLKTIEDLWDKDDLDFYALATNFQRIISTIDNYKEDLSDPLYGEEPPSLPGG